MSKRHLNQFLLRSLTAHSLWPMIGEVESAENRSGIVIDDEQGVHNPGDQANR